MHLMCLCLSSEVYTYICIIYGLSEVLLVILNYFFVVLFFKWIPNHVKVYTFNYQLQYQLYNHSLSGTREAQFIKCTCNFYFFFFFYIHRLFLYPFHLHLFENSWVKMHNLRGFYLLSFMTVFLRVKLYANFQLWSTIIS